MVSNNFFFKKKINISDLFPKEKFKKKIILNNIKSLGEATKLDLTFYDSKKYKNLANQTKARYCITTENLSEDLPKSIEKIIVNKVLVELARVSKIMYPFSDLDYPDFSLKKPAKSKFKTVKFGNNVLIGKNVKIGKNSQIGANTIIEHDVQIGDNCIIGSTVIIKNSLIDKRVVIQDNCKIGQKGFGFLPNKGKNFKFPHFGKVVINSDVVKSKGKPIVAYSKKKTDLETRA